MTTIETLKRYTKQRLGGKDVVMLYQINNKFVVSSCIDGKKRRHVTKSLTEAEHKFWLGCLHVTK